LQKRLIDISV